MLLVVNPERLDVELKRYEAFDKFEVQILRELLDETARHACPQRKNVAKKLLVLVESGMN